MSKMNKLVEGSTKSLVRSYSNMMVNMVGFCVALALLCGCPDLKLRGGDNAQHVNKANWTCVSFHSFYLPDFVLIHL